MFSYYKYLSLNSIDVCIISVYMFCDNGRLMFALFIYMYAKV